MRIDGNQARAVPSRQHLSSRDGMKVVIHRQISKCCIRPQGLNTNKWFWFLHAVLWADRTSIRKRLGCSPYFMLTGAHPVLPLDAAEATWLVKPPIGIITDEELIGMRA